MYERKVIYLFQYHHNTAGKSVGYIKWSRSQDNGKLLLYIKGLHLTKDTIGECSLLLKNNKIRIGKVYIKNAVAEERYSLDKELCRKMSDENLYPTGILVTFGTVQCAASFSTDMIDLGMYSEEMSTDEKKSETEDSKEKYKTIEKMVEKRIEEKTEENRETDETSATEDVYYRLKELFPTVFPFEKVENKEFLSITPREIEFFRKKYFTLINNSFLLHGYQNYKYLILGKDRDQNKYSIGVPGVYYEKEEMMAKVFGFDQFESALDTEKKEGCFGYYMKTLE